MANPNYNKQVGHTQIAAPKGGGPKLPPGVKHSIKEGGPTYAKLPGPASAFKRDFAKFGARAVKIYRTDQNVVDTPIMPGGFIEGPMQGGAFQTQLSPTATGAPQPGFMDNPDNVAAMAKGLGTIGTGMAGMAKPVQGPIDQSLPDNAQQASIASMARANRGR